MRVRHTKRDANHGDVLDILVAGYNVDKHGYEMVMVEIKPDEKAPFTEDEQRILKEQPHTTMVAYSAEDVLRRFGRFAS